MAKKNYVINGRSLTLCRRLTLFYLYKLKNLKIPFGENSSNSRITFRSLWTPHTATSRQIIPLIDVLSSQVLLKVVHTLMSFQTTQKLSACVLLNWKYKTNSSVWRRKSFAAFQFLSCLVSLKSFKRLQASKVFGKLMKQSVRRLFLSSSNEHFSVLKNTH